MASIDDLTFGEYVRALERPEIWQKVGLRVEKSLFTQELGKVRQIRNSIMHFHPDGITEEERDTLAKTREMLADLQGR